MITNTNRILYNSEYIPAYIQDATKKVRYKGSNYSVEFQEVQTDKVYKVELENHLVVYLSDCNIEVDDNLYQNVSSVKAGDTVLTYYDNQTLFTKYYNARSLALAFLGDKNAEQDIKVKYKLKHLNDYKLLRNNADFLSSFICELIRESKVSMLEEYQYLRGSFNYELLQELSLAFSMFGIVNFLSKDRGSRWSIYINIRDFLANLLYNEPKYKVIPMKVAQVNMIEQDTQAFKVSCSRIVANTIMLKGDV